MLVHVRRQLMEHYVAACSAMLGTRSVILTCVGTGRLAQLGLLLHKCREGEVFPFSMGKKRAALIDLLGCRPPLEGI